MEYSSEREDAAKIYRSASKMFRCILDLPIEMERFSPINSLSDIHDLEVIRNDDGFHPTDITSLLN